MGPMGTVYLPTHDTELMRSPAYTNYPAAAFSSFAGSGDSYYDYLGNDPSGYLGGIYPS